jgi:hypothetical protein
MANAPQSPPTDAESDTTPLQTPEQPSQSEQQVRQRGLGSFLSWFHQTIRDVWFYVAAVSLIINLVHTFRPQISIQVGATIPNQPVLTLFTLTNSGSWILYNITTKCAIWSGHNWIVSQGNVVELGPTSPLAGNPDIHSLAPTEIATQDCAISALMAIPTNDSIRIDIQSEYDWLFGHTSTGRHFDMRRFGGQLVLVPDVERREGIPPPPSS